MTITFRGLIAPTEVPTGDGRMFAAGKLTHRPLPIPLMARFGSGGHENATPVGIIERIFDGPGGYWCEGKFLDPTKVPEVVKAVYMLGEKVLGPSVDLDRDFTVEAIPHPSRPDKKAGMFKEYNVIGTTLVPMPAFHQVHLSVDNDEEKSLLASVGILVDNWEQFSDDEEDLEGTEPQRTASFDVNGESWRNWPVAPRNYTFDADDAVKRIAYWAGIGSKSPSVDRYASTFLWRNGSQTGDTLAQDSFRLPLADIINGEPYLIYHAVYSAAALLSGGHGGLPQIPDNDKAQMVRVINEIYATLAGVFRDENLKSPFLTRVRPEEMAAVTEAALALDSSDCGCDNADSIPSELSEGNVPSTTGVNVVMDHTPALSVTTTAGSQSYTVSSDVSATNVTVTFSPVLPPDVLKSVHEQRRPYDGSGCHFNEDGTLCVACGTY